jgi:hypothetical protein
VGALTKVPQASINFANAQFLSTGTPARSGATALTIDKPCINALIRADGRSAGHNDTTILQCTHTVVLRVTRSRCTTWIKYLRQTSSAELPVAIVSAVSTKPCSTARTFDA